MIPITDPSLQAQSWQSQLQHAITDRNTLLRTLELPAEPLTTNFPIKVPLAYLGRIEKKCPDDPLLKQVLSLPAENQLVAGFAPEPLNETAFSPIKGLIHKYQHRVLIVTTGTCAINCRYCFRRNFDYEDNQPSSIDWQAIVQYIKSDPGIKEVILSGGEPLILSDRRLCWIIDQLGEIPHLVSLRIHTRMPVVIPDRVCESMLAWVKTCPLKLVLVTHINHPNEIDDAVVAAMKLLTSHKVTLLNQSVLLKDINDDATTLVRLSERLFFAGILPYYLHLLDPVAGAAHFDVERALARELVIKVRGQLPGYLVPRLAQEVPGETAKRIIG